MKRIILKMMFASRTMSFVCCLMMTMTLIAVAQTNPSEHEKPRNEVKLDGAAFDDVLNRLFGTGGLLQGDRPFQLHAEDIVLTRQQFDNFFNPTAPNAMDFINLVAGAEPLHGQVHLEGTVDGVPFEFKLAGREIKMEGLPLTQSELDTLVARLRTVEGIREFKIEASVDGKPVEVKAETKAGQLRVQTKGEEHESASTHHEKGPEGLGSNERVAVNNSGFGRAETMERAEKPEKIEKVERVERVERTERPERPESSGRH